jgi:hypothetical protein
MSYTADQLDAFWSRLNPGALVGNGGGLFLFHV